MNSAIGFGWRTPALRSLRGQRPLRSVASVPTLRLPCAQPGPLAGTARASWTLAGRQAMAVACRHPGLARGGGRP
eukprot:1412847-Lingulodinium_polyedra.AAC.1